MAVKLTSIAYTTISPVNKYIGLSTDNYSVIPNLKNGDEYFAIDTKEKYIYNGNNWYAFDSTSEYINAMLNKNY